MDYFPKEIMVYLRPFRQVFSKSTWPYFKGFLLALLLASGRRTVAQVTRFCFFIDRDQSSFNRFLFQYKWDRRKVSVVLLKLLFKLLKGRLLVHGGPLIALDTTLVKKAGKKVLGLQRFRDSSGNSNRGGYVWGHHWGVSGLLTFHEKLSRFLSWPLLAGMIPGKKTDDHFTAGPEGVRPTGFWDVALGLVFEFKLLLEKAGAIPGEKCPLRVVADGYFSKAPFINPLFERGIHVISRLRKDRVGWGDPPAPPPSGRVRGRPPKKGEKLKLANLLEEREPVQVEATLYGEKYRVNVVAVDVTLRNLEEKVRVVVVENKNKGSSRPVLLVSTDRDLSAREILEIYAGRFSLEIAIRDLKEEFGLGHYQLRKPLAIRRFIHLVLFARSFWALVLLKVRPEWLFKGCRNDSIPIGEVPLSWRLAKRKLRAYLLFAYVHSIYRKSARDADFEKVKEQYEPISQILF